MANVITNGGRAHWVSRQRGLGAELKYVGMGTGAGTAGVADVDLFTPSTEARVSGSSSSVTTNVANDSHQVQALIIADALKTFTNVGLWDALTGGTLGAKSDFAGIQLNAGDGINWTLKTVVS